MAITDVILKTRGSLRQTSDGEELTDVWTIVTDSSSHDQIYVAENAVTSGLPEYFSRHPQRSTLAVYDIRFDPDGESTHIWTATLEYSSRQSDFQTRSNSGNWTPDVVPPLRPPVIKLQSVNVQMAFDKDLDGEYLQSSAGEVFDPPYVRTIKNSLLTITRYESMAEFNDDKRLTYLEKVNASAFGSKPAKSVLIRDIYGEVSYENGIPYWLVTYELEYSRREQKWEVWIPDVGYKMVNGTGKTEDIYLDKSAGGAPIAFSSADLSEDVPTSSPWRLSSGVPITNPATATEFIKYREFDTVDFDALKLPGSL